MKTEREQSEGVRRDTYSQREKKIKSACGPMPNVMATLQNIDGANHERKFVIMVALCNRADHYIFILFLLLLLLLSSSSFFSSPNLSGRRLDVYHTLAHGVALVRI